MKLTGPILVLGAFLAVARHVRIFEPSTSTPSIEETGISERDAESVLEWPTTAGVFKSKRDSVYTNAELMKRGRPINRPRKLYKAVSSRVESRAHIEKRVVAPATAPSPGINGRRTYNLIGCYSGGGDNFEYGPMAKDSYEPYTTPAQLADDCAAAQDRIAASAGEYSSFLIYTAYIPTYDCTVGIKLLPGAVAGPCDTQTFALYN